MRGDRAGTALGTTTTTTLQLRGTTTAFKYSFDNAWFFLKRNLDDWLVSRNISLAGWVEGGTLWHEEHNVRLLPRV